MLFWVEFVTVIPEIIIHETEIWLQNEVQLF